MDTHIISCCISLLSQCPRPVCRVQVSCLFQQNKQPPSLSAAIDLVVMLWAAQGHMLTYGLASLPGRPDSQNWTMDSTCSGSLTLSFSVSLSFSLSFSISLRLCHPLSLSLSFSLFLTHTDTHTHTHTHTQSLSLSDFRFPMNVLSCNWEIYICKCVSSGYANIYYNLNNIIESLDPLAHSERCRSIILCSILCCNRSVQLNFFL